MIKLIKLIFIVCVSSSLISCSSHDQEVQDFVDDIKKNSTGKVNELPAAKEYRGEDYAAKNLRSPFDSGVRAVRSSQDAPQDTKITQAPRPDANRPREYLERYPLEDYIMVGTISKGNYIWGLVQDKTGMVHAIKVGDYIGENSGKVIGINNDEIAIEETVVNGKGGWTQREVALVMQQGADRVGT